MEKEKPRDEILEYFDRFKNMPAEEILKYMGELRDFFYKYMTPEGREFFEKSKNAGSRLSQK